jgi:hypothetical protein
MEQSKQFSLNRTDFEKWLRNTVIFSAPALLAFAVAIQSGASLEVAGGMASQALLAAAIDLLRKYTAGE